MHLQGGCWDFCGDGALNSSGDSLRLPFPICEEQTLLRVHDGADSHGNRHFRDRLQRAAKVRGVGETGAFGERLDTGSGS